MKYYAVVDTNVIVSAFIKPTSVPGRVLSLVFVDTLVPLINDEILAEYSDVLSRAKFKFNQVDVKEFISIILQKGISISAEHLDIDLPDPKDCVFYEVTMEARKDHDARLVTGNTKHFPAEPYVVTPRQLLEIIGENLESRV